LIFSFVFGVQPVVLDYELTILAARKWGQRKLETSARNAHVFRSEDDARKKLFAGLKNSGEIGDFRQEKTPPVGPSTSSMALSSRQIDSYFRNLREWPFIRPLNAGKPREPVKIERGITWQNRRLTN
jgi:hypothetical protein